LAGELDKDECDRLNGAFNWNELGDDVAELEDACILAAALNVIKGKTQLAIWRHIGHEYSRFDDLDNYSSKVFLYELQQSKWR
jgi:DNA-binding HxlR family transcriptional regulator